MTPNPALATSSVADSLSPQPPTVADQLDQLLGEHLMPLRARTPGADEPYLLAVDASGEPVVVEVVPVLDEAAIVTALRHAGRAARMSTRDLAQAYQGGADRFAGHLAAFRRTVPATALLSTFVRGGARLLLVCTHVSPGVADVLEFLLQPGWQVDVLRARVVTEPDGQRVVELSPVVRPAGPRRELDLPTRPGAPRRDDVLFDPTPVFRSTPVPRFSDRPSPSAFGGWERPADPLGLGPLAGPATPPHAPVAPPATTPPVPSATAPVAAPGEREVVDPVLVALADALDGPAPLVWCDRTGTSFEALLRADGVIQLADGATFGDLDAATRAISGDDGPLDAWEMWRVDGPGGPTLAELARAVFPDQF
jgi:hypothetical protein